MKLQIGLLTLKEQTIDDWFNNKKKPINWNLLFVFSVLFAFAVLLQCQFEGSISS